MLTLKIDDIQLGAQAADKVSAIRLVAARLNAAGLVTEAYVDGMLHREEQTATYLGSGIAIPHGTTDTRDLVLQTGVQVLHFPDGVEWADGQKAYVVIGIAAKSDEHLGILRQLTRVLSDDEVTARLPGVRSAAELAALLNGEQLSQPLLLDDSTLRLDAPAGELAALQATAAELLRQGGALTPASVQTVLATAANPLGQGLWLARVAADVLRTGVAFVRAAQPFSHEGLPVQGLLLIAARDAQHMPVLERLIALISEQKVAALWSATAAEVVKLLTTAPQDGLEATFTIINPHGLHARPSAMLVKAVKEFSSQIWVANLDGDGKAVNAKSLMKLVSLGVRQGHRLHFTAKGEDAELALQSIGQAITDGLGEGEGAGE